MGRTETFYILGSSKPLDFYRVEHDNIFTDTFDKLNHSFPELPVVNLRLHARELGEQRQGLIIGIDRERMQFVSYGEGEYNWNWLPENRRRQEDLFYQLLHNKLALDFKTFKAIERRLLTTRGPYLVLVNCSKLSKKGRPSPRQMEEFIINHARDKHGLEIETELWYEGANSGFPKFRRAEFGLRLTGSLDDVAGNLGKRTDLLLANLGQHYMPRAYVFRKGSSENLK